jgi:hypothetical protein
MFSTNTYTTFIHNQYVVYHITYYGNKLPPKSNKTDIAPSNYIGSTSLKEIIENNYLGSVGSKIYKCIWEKETKQNPHLFHREIISYHDTRQEALWKELQIQKIFNVVKNPLFVNLAYAQKNGFFGMLVSGKYHPNYGRKHTAEHTAKSVAGKLGKKRTSEQNLTMANAQCSNWTIINPTGEELKIRNLKKFCVDFNLN